MFAIDSRPDVLRGAHLSTLPAAGSTTTEARWQASDCTPPRMLLVEMACWSWPVLFGLIDTLMGLGL